MIVDGQDQHIKLLALSCGECQKSVDFAFFGYYNGIRKGAKALKYRGRRPEIEGGNLL